MRRFFHRLFVAVLLLTSWPAPAGDVLAAELDTSADLVLGQVDFTSVNNGGVPGINATSITGPTAVAVDGHGNLYVSDSANHRVLEYDAPLANHASADRVFGQPNFISNSANTLGLNASGLYLPFSLALDASGNLYVADTGNNRVLEYDAPLTHDTTADRVYGQSNFSANAPNAGGLNSGGMHAPEGLALDLQGNLYVADTFNNRVLRFDAPLNSDPYADLVIGQTNYNTNTVNNGGLNAAGLNTPTGIAVDAAGNLYVADQSNQRVLEYDAPLANHASADLVFGQPSFITNTPNHGASVGATTLHTPVAVAVDVAGNVYITDYLSNRVLEYDRPLVLGTTADRVFGQLSMSTFGSNQNGRSDHSLGQPEFLSIDPQGNLWVPDWDNERVLRYDAPLDHPVPSLAALSPATVAAGGPGFTVTVNGAGFVAGSVVRWNGSSRPTTFISSARLQANIAAGDIAVGGPYPVTVFTPAPGGGSTNSLNLTLYARAEQDNVADLVFGQPDFAGNAGTNPALAEANQLDQPNGAAIDPHSGRLFVVDHQNNRVLSWPGAAALANTQAADVVLGQPNALATLPNSTGLNASSLNGPTGVAVDALGNVYVADNSNNRVLEYFAPLATGQAAQRVFGQGGSFTTATFNNGGRGPNSLAHPAGVSVDALGNVSVADSGNHRVLRYDAPATHDTTADLVLGQPDFAQGTVNNGGLSAASLNRPTELVSDAAGSLYVVDTLNHRVLQFSAPLATHASATRVFGQPGFAANVPNNGGLSAGSLRSPVGIALDGQGNLFLADLENNRVLEYDTPQTLDTTADRVFGQPSFITRTVNNGGVSAISLNSPYGLALDAHGNLFVADDNNNRVLMYARPLPLMELYLPLLQR